MELEYRRLSFKLNAHEELDLPDIVASAILYDYEAMLQEKIARKQGR